MHEQNPRIALGFGVVEVRHDAQRLQRRLGVLPGIDFALAYRVYARAVAEQLVVQLLELAWSSARLGVSEGFSPATTAPCSTSL